MAKSTNKAAAKATPAKKTSAIRARRSRRASAPKMASIKSSTPSQNPGPPDGAVVDRLVAEAEAGIPAEKLRRRGRPAIGAEAASTYSVRLPDDLALLTDERSAIDGVSRGETIRRALIDYLAT